MAKSRKPSKPSKKDRDDKWDLLSEAFTARRKAVADVEAEVAKAVPTPEEIDRLPKEEVDALDNSAEAAFQQLIIALEEECFWLRRYRNALKRAKDAAKAQKE